LIISFFVPFFYLLSLFLLFISSSILGITPSNGDEGLLLRGALLPPVANHPLGGLQPQLNLM